MTTSPGAPTVHHPATVAEAVALMAAGAVPLAGATWVMRGPALAPAHVALTRLAELRGIAGGSGNGRGGTGVSGTVVVGALTTHAELAAWDAPAALAALRTAAAESAFPQVRNIATVGGNIGAVGFAEADLVPALLALGARVRRAGPDGTSTVELAEHLAARPAGTLVLAVELDVPAEWRSGSARLTVRGGGEYAIASVALAVERDAGGTVTAARAAVGSVEPVARRCAAAEAALLGSALTADSARAAGAAAAAELTARDGLDAPGWYRAAVLPVLFERAAARATAEETR